MKNVEFGKGKYNLVFESDNILYIHMSELLMDGITIKKYKKLYLERIIVLTNFKLDKKTNIK